MRVEAGDVLAGKAEALQLPLGPAEPAVLSGEGNEDFALPRDWQGTVCLRPGVPLLVEQNHSENQLRVTSTSFPDRLVDNLRPVDGIPRGPSCSAVGVHEISTDPSLTSWLVERLA